MSKGKWEKVGSNDGIIGAFVPGPRHTIVRNLVTGKAHEVYHRSGKLGEAIEEGQFTGRDVSSLDKTPSGSGGCFITTACVEAAGLPDDCFELQILRKFRDEYVRLLPDGEVILKAYYSKAPGIVKAISQSDSANDEYLRMFREVREAIRHILAGHNKKALDTYKQLVQRLLTTYSTEID